jgi:hypothetical protein
MSSEKERKHSQGKSDLRPETRKWPRPSGMSWYCTHGWLLQGRTVAFSFLDLFLVLGYGRLQGKMQMTGLCSTGLVNDLMHPTSPAIPFSLREINMGAVRLTGLQVKTRLGLVQLTPEVAFTVPNFNPKTHSKIVVLWDYSVQLLVFFLSLLVFTVPRLKNIVLRHWLICLLVFV